MNIIENKLFWFAISMLFNGITMIIFPDFYNEGTKLNFGNPGTVYAGISFVLIGGVILLSKFYKWYNVKKKKKDEKHNDNASS